MQFSLKHFPTCLMIIKTNPNVDSSFCHIHPKPIFELRANPTHPEQVNEPFRHDYNAEAGKKLPDAASK